MSRTEPVFEVIHPGMLTTVQDLGRRGYQKYGLAVSGAADAHAHRMANLLLGNPVDAATLEVTLMGLKVRVLKPAVIAITGGDLDPRLNGQPLLMWSTVPVHPGDVIHFSGCKSGCRAYLAVSGGIDVPVVLGSRSTDLLGGIGGVAGRKLEKGDLLFAGPARVPADKVLRRRLHPDWVPQYPRQVEVRVVLGPQEDAFTPDGIATFLSSEYTVSTTSDRMGLRLMGPTVGHKHGADILSEGLFMGAVQVPQNGQPIVFLVGRQSVGGYTKIAGVITVDMPWLAQLKPGDTIRFRQVTVAEAHRLLREYERFFAAIKVWGSSHLSA
ncbi:biotin-dependent carboxyltransferase family protein [Kyrpidia sp.]|uniref:5-oxoprolinase subunit C family protein n=1 Tax=Kyrpidia sp. TaxID=2073077 RepID=UPI002587AC15|nr:biotin-dependent carboxyltransferase family protein [Kyrpidia sp.]